MHNITKQMEGPLPAASQLESRHKYWHSQALLTTKMAIAAKLLSMGARLLTIPMALHMLGPERYGLWLSISSLLLWIGFVGPGLGYGLINSVSEANGKNDRQKMRADISTASITIVALGFSLLIMLPICSAWSGWARLLGVHDQSALAEDAKVLTLASRGHFWPFAIFRICSCPLRCFAGRLFDVPCHRCGHCRNARRYSFSSPLSRHPNQFRTCGGTSTRARQFLSTVVPVWAAPSRTVSGLASLESIQFSLSNGLWGLDVAEPGSRVEHISIGKPSDCKPLRTFRSASVCRSGRDLS